MQNEKRDRLIELIKEARTEVPFPTSEGEIVTTVKRRIVDLYEAVELADHLIENGVTVQKWISVKDRLPEKEGEVLVCDTREDFISTWEYLGKGLWLYDDIFWGTDDITHWMPLPQPPKGETE